MRAASERSLIGPSELLFSRQVGISGTQLEITAEFSGTSSEPFGVSVLSGSGGKTNLVVDQTREYVLIDGTAQGNPKPRAGPILGGSDKVWSKCSSSLGGCLTVCV